MAFFISKQRRELEDKLDKLSKQNFQLLRGYDNITATLYEMRRSMLVTIDNFEKRFSQNEQTILQIQQVEIDKAVAKLIEEQEKCRTQRQKDITGLGEKLGDHIDALAGGLTQSEQRLFAGHQATLEKEAERVFHGNEESNRQLLLQTQEILSSLVKIYRTSLCTVPNPLLSIELHVVEHCNLNCKMCSHFSCIAEEEYLEPDCFERDMARLAQLFGSGINHIRLLGGEPLLHPRLNELLLIARKYFPENCVEIVTNGITLAEQPDSFWEICKNCRIVICCTEYPISLDYRELERIVAEKGVRYLTERVGKNTQHCLPLKLDPWVSEGRGRQRAAEHFFGCFLVNTSTSLYHGKLFPCAVACNIRHFNRFFNQSLPISHMDYIDIHEVKDAGEIMDFLSHPVPFCRFCDIPHRKFGLEWGLTQGDIREWSL